MAPHNPQGPCSLAASLQVRASIPNFLIQERGDNEYSDLLAKPLPPVRNGHRPILTEPGLGITIDENKLMAQVGEPRLHHPAVRHRRRLGGRLVSRHLKWAILACFAIAGLGVWAATNRRLPRRSPSTIFSRRYCVGCHGAKSPAGGFTLTGHRGGTPLRHAGVEGGGAILRIVPPARRTRGLRSRSAVPRIELDVGAVVRAAPILPAAEPHRVPQRDPRSAGAGR
ncbi:MAG: hypothetical protein IPM24_28505 [Bryobacterales bacterium]|nr:hypothetical protein [Bryobacterales bacterium]